MNYAQRSKKQRPWLRKEILVVTHELKEFLKSNQKLEETDKRKLCLIQNHLIRNSNDRRNDFINVSSDKWASLLGKNYRRYINYLADIQCLEVNERYSNTSNNTRKSFSKSYRIPTSASKASSKTFCPVEFSHSRIQSYKDESDLNHPLNYFIHSNLQLLTVGEKLKPISDQERAAYALEDCKRMFLGAFNVKMGKKSNRISHAVIRMVKEARENLVYRIGTTKLCYCDITACFPNLLPSWMSNESEKNLFLDILSGDFYANIKEQLRSKKSRVQIKKDMVIFLSDPKHEAGMYLGDWFNRKLTFFYQWKINQKSLALILQKKEAGIINLLCEYCRKSKTWFVPMYDGFLCLEDDADHLTECCHAIFKKHVGHIPKLARHCW